MTAVNHKQATSSPSLDSRILNFRTLGLQERVDMLIQEMGRLDALSLRLCTLIAQDDADAVLALVAEREEIVAMVGPLSASIEHDWSKFSPREQDPLLAGKISAIMGMAGAIAARDQEDMKALETTHERISTQLAELAVASRASRAYGDGPLAAPGVVPARFQDREA